MSNNNSSNTEQQEIQIPTTSNFDESHNTSQYVSNRELMVFKAQICEQANRFEDMVATMKELTNSVHDLTVDERNLLSCAFKNVIGSRRTSWRILNESLEESTSSSSSQTTTITTREDRTNCDKATNSSIDRRPIIKSIMSNIESELKSYCNDILSILITRLIPSVSATGESRVFYYKMKGDYIRYLCETCTGAERKDKANESLLAYKTASDRALIELPPTHPVRLGLMLNFSVFYYEIMKSPERSCRLAKQAFDDAIAELDTLSEEGYRDSTIIMQLLRDNLNLWESEQQNSQPINDLIQQGQHLHIHNQNHQPTQQQIQQQQ